MCRGVNAQLIRQGRLFQVEYAMEAIKVCSLPLIARRTLSIIRHIRCARELSAWTED